MRTPSGAFTTVIALILVSFSFISCGDNTIDAPLVQPVQIVDENPEILNVSIQVYTCSTDQNSLLVFNPDQSNPEFYRHDRYDISWFVGDGHELSETVWLECVHEGVYSVQIKDMLTGVKGSNIIYL